MSVPKIVALGHRATVHHGKQTAAQIDAHIHVHKAGLGRRLSSRPVVHRSAAHIDARIARVTKALRTKHPETPGT